MSSGSPFVKADAKAYRLQDEAQSRLELNWNFRVRRFVANQHNFFLAKFRGDFFSSGYRRHGTFRINYGQTIRCTEAICQTALNQDDFFSFF
jgi:hypothetical protein